MVILFSDGIFPKPFIKPKMLLGKPKFFTLKMNLTSFLHYIACMQLLLFDICDYNYRKSQFRSIIDLKVSLFLWLFSYPNILLKGKVNSISNILIISKRFTVRIQYHRDVQTKSPCRSIPFRIWFNSYKSKNEHWRLNWHFLISGWWKLGNMELLSRFANTSWLTCYRWTVLYHVIFEMQ